MRDLGDDLNRLEVPEHRSGFWAELDDEMRTTPTVPSRPPRSTPRRWMALAAATATVAAFAFLPGLLTGGGDVADDPGDLAPPSSTAPTTTVAPSTTVTDPGPTQAGNPPWGAGSLTQEQVPALFAAVWQKAENRAWCSALAPNSATPVAEPREAYFGGGWAVAYDRADGPGRNADGSYCADCGRSAYGIAGVGLAADVELVRSRPEVRTYSDGSIVAVYPEGLDPSSGFLLADLVLPGEGCLYQAWSALGRDHLEGLLAQLRKVEGLQAATITQRTDADTKRIEGGAPPWDAPHIDAPGLLAVAFGRSLDSTEIPVLGFAEVGPGLDSAVLRPAAIGNWGVGWDNPDGPGHDSLNYPCADCGRGAIGIGGFGPYDPAGAGEWARPALAEITWDDGSLAIITWRIGDLRLPESLVLYPDPKTGEMIPDGVQAMIYIPNAGIYQVWSHFGYDHLLSLIEALRFVER